MKKFIEMIINLLLPAGSVRNIVIRALYRGVIRRNPLKLLLDDEYDGIIAEREEYRIRSEEYHTKYNEVLGKYKVMREYVSCTYSRAYENSPEYVPFKEKGFTFQNDDPRLIAFYLPQYHPVPENDEFFGKGFTEWRNVVRAKPLFNGHYQPRLPDELGFYDTRIRDVLKRQIEIAKAYGIYGFCFHHYWFSGKPMLRVPFNHIMADPGLDIPFCLNWANEPWTVRWDGFDTKNGVVMAQKHSPDDDIAFMKDIEPALHDGRYIRIDGRPLLIIYRPGLFPDIRATVDRWNEYLTGRGIGPLYLAYMQTNYEGRLNSVTGGIEMNDPGAYGFDAAVEFPHHGHIVLDRKEGMELFYPGFSGQIFSYRDMMAKCMNRKKEEYTLFRGIMPGWDCTARRINPIIFTDSTPGRYREWLAAMIEQTKSVMQADRQLIFINAWNEWAEGAYLEPDRRWGFAYLDATRRALLDARRV